MIGQIPRLFYSIAQSRSVSNSPIIEARHLKKHYKTGEKIIKALDDVTLSIEKGEFVMVIGPSGSGKSTLVNMLGGVDVPDDGEVIFRGEPLGKTSRELTQFRRKYVSFVFQFYSLIPTLTAKENIELAAELVIKSRKKLTEIAEEALEAVGLGDRKNSYPSQLSGGERQRVALARALSKKPELLIIDEPTGQLDEETGKKIVELIRDTSKAQGTTVLMVTHDLELERFSDRVLKMRSGKILEG